MSELNSIYVAQETFAGATSPATLTTAMMTRARQHQIAVEGAASTTGTLALKAIPYGKTTAEVVLNEAGAAVVIDLAAEGVVIVDGVYSAFTFTPTAVTGGAATYLVTALGLE